MTWVATAIIGSSIIGAIGSNSAADTQASAANNAAQLTQQQYQNTVAQEQPYLQSGYGAQSQLNYLLGIGQNPSQAQAPSGTGYGYSAGSGYGGAAGMNAYYGGYPYSPSQGGSTSAMQPTTSSTAGGFGSLLSPFTADTFKQYSPAYQFQLQQGQQGVLNGDSSSAGALSGAAQKDLMSFNQNEANTAFNNAFNQYQTQQGNVYTRLANVANLGQNAASNTGQIGANLAGSTAQSITNAGSASAAGQVGVANSLSGGVNSAIPWLMNGSGGGGSAYEGSGTSFTGADGMTQTISDRRLKKNVTKLSTRPDGLGVYSFSYIWENVIRVGLMAQEVLEVYPDAVCADANGFYSVKYAMVG